MRVLKQEIEFEHQPFIIRQQNLKNKDFTIISANCIGGVIYHDLGLRFDSPTINLWFMAQDFLRFIKNLRYYLSLDNLMEDVEETKKNNYPVGTLGKGKKRIKIYFMHYPDFKTAREKWNLRKQRIHYDNLYIIMTDRDGADEKLIKDFDSLKFPHKVMLTGRDYPQYKSTYYIHDCEENGHLGAWYQSDNMFSPRRFEQFNYVDFFNQQ